MATQFEEVQIGRVHANVANIRTDMGDMETLASEVKTIGIRNPLLVYPHPELEGDYLVQDGHRRLAAARTNGALFVPCLIVDAPRRGVREDIEVMLSTGRAAKVLNPLEVSYGFEQLVADGMDETTIGKKYKVPKSEVKARARVSAAPAGLKESFAEGKLSLVDMKRIQDLEDAGVPEVFAEVVEGINDRLKNGWGINVESIIAAKEESRERERLREELLGLGAKPAKDSTIKYDGQHDRVTEDMSVAEHIAAKHVFILEGTTTNWWARRVKAKPVATAEEIQAAQEIRSLDAGLAIQARVRRRFLVEQVTAKESAAGKDADFELLFGLAWQEIRQVDDELLAELTGISVPGEIEDAHEEAAAMAKWSERVEKRFRSFSWQQLARAATLAKNWSWNQGLASTKAFNRENWQWAQYRDWYATAQTEFGYRLDETERNALLWDELRYDGSREGVVIIDAEVGQ